MGKPHVVVLPYPAQGHVRPLMELSHRLASCGFKITFINTDFIHKRMVDSHSNDNKELSMIRMISIPDGLEPEDDRTDLHKLYVSIIDYMPGKLEEIIQGINGSKPEEEDMISCIIADENMCWAFEVAAKMGLKRVGFSPHPATILAHAFHIENLIDEGIIDDEGNPLKDQAIDLSPGMPAMRATTNSTIGSSSKEVIMYYAYRNRHAKTVNQVPDWILCNSSFVLEPAAFTIYPKMLPIGPMLPGSRLGHSSGSFWPQDTTCLEWLDQQPAKSVIYVAFGSFTSFDPKQFEELALGLELSEKRFLWVIRPDSSQPYPDGFQTRISTRGRIVDWAPQQDVLSHPSVACFLSHCGWNSTIEGVCNGVPFLCWPYHADQFLTQDYFCDYWKTGLKFNRDENGIITRKEIIEKVERIFIDDEIKRNATKLKEMVEASWEDGGQSSENFKKFLEKIK